MQAADAGDLDAFLAAFTGDAVVDDWGREFRGPAAVRRWSDSEFIGVQVQLRVISVAVEGPVVTVAAYVGGNGFNGPSHFAFHLDSAGELIRRMTITG